MDGYLHLCPAPGSELRRLPPTPAAGGSCWARSTLHRSRSPRSTVQDEVAEIVALVQRPRAILVDREIALAREGVDARLLAFQVARRSADVEPLVVDILLVGQEHGDRGGEHGNK